MRMLLVILAPRAAPLLWCGARADELTRQSCPHRGAGRFIGGLKGEALLGDDGREQIAKPSMTRIGIVASVPEDLLLEEWHVERNGKGAHSESSLVKGHEPRRDHRHQVRPADRVQGQLKCG